MSRRMVWFGLALVVGLTAAVPAWSADVSIAFVNTARLMEQSPQARQATERLEREFGPRDERLAALGKQIQDLEERRQRDGAIMGEGERQQLERDLVSRTRDFQRAQAEFGEDLKLRRSEELGQLQRLAAEAVMAVAREGGYDLVLESGVIFASERVDITDRVLARMQEQAGQ